MDRAGFYSRVRAKPFGRPLTQSKVDGCNVLLDATEALPLQHRAYVLATAYHETAGTMQPIAEYGKGKGHPYGIVDKTGKAPYGRGYDQFTWAPNYLKADTELGLGGALAKNYDLALQASIAAKIIVRGMT